MGFYNGSPDDTDLKVDLDCDSAAVIGLGNVALDVARVLLTPVDVLRKTDITEAALDALSASRIKHVHVVGRRGPLHVAFTIKELREMVTMPGCKPVFDARDFVGVKEAVASLQRPRKRLTELLAKTALDPPSGKQAEAWGKGHDRTWSLKLLRTPTEFVSDGCRVSGLKCEVNRLVGNHVSEAQTVEGTGEYETLECGLVLKSIGYKSVPVEEGIPFDEKKGVIPNENGKVSANY